MAVPEVESAMTGLSQLCLTDTAAITITDPEPDYFLHLDSQSCQECGEDAKIAATSTNNSIRVYSRSNLGYCHTIYGHDKSLTGVRFSPSDPNLLYTSSLDGTIKCWDLRERLKAKASDSHHASLEYSGYDETHNVFTSFDISCDGKILCAGTEAKGDDAHIIFWDCRKSDRLGVYSDCFNDDVTQVRFHPSQKDTLISGSSDGLLCLFDISEGSEEDALTQTFNAEACLSRIGWCGYDDKSIYGLTSIDSLHVWDSVEFDPVYEITDVKDKMEGEVDYLVDACHLRPPAEGDTGLHLLAGTHSGSVRLLRAGQRGSEKFVEPETEVGLATPLKDVKSHNALVRCMAWDLQSRSLVTGGEDGLVCLWRPNAQSSPAREKTKLKAKSATKVRRKDRGKAYSRS